MRLVLEQRFPLGRFHATPWRVNPFDDPHGEWPPSPWRLIRAVIARWYQWDRETGQGDKDMFHDLLGALANSSYSYYLPPTARPGAVSRQYQPTKWVWEPENNKGGRIPSARTHKRSLVQDNCWAVPSDEPLLWFVEGDGWTPSVTELLDECLVRVTWFGRADSFSTIRRVEVQPDQVPNCLLHERGAAGHVRVLCPLPAASREDFERVTDDPLVIGRSVPPGAMWRFASPPPSVPLRRRHHPPTPTGRVDVVQFSLNAAVAPELRSLCRLTARYRDRAVGALVQELEGQRASWSGASRATRERLAPFVGKDADSEPLRGRRHARFAVWVDDGRPSRLIAWRRADPYADVEVVGFDDQELMALLRAATRPLTWSASGAREPGWSVSVIPLPLETPCPHGFDGAAARIWVSVTPYVPSRHRIRRGVVRDGEDVESQVRRELKARGWPVDGLHVKTLGPPRWTAVHLPPSQRAKRAFIGDRMGFELELQFSVPVRGPICLGQSSMLGLGLFAPVGQGGG